MNTDYLIIGTGVAGLSLAIQLAERLPQKRITLVTKSDIKDSNTYLAQGGIAVVSDSIQDSFINHIKDTIDSGDGLSNPQVVDMVVRQAPDRIRELVSWGVQFDLNSNNTFHLAKEGGHSSNRIIHKGDFTGKEIINALVARIKHYKNIQVKHHCMAIDLLKHPVLLSCEGISVLNNRDYTIESIYAQKTVLATGGIGKVYQSSTNPEVATGDGIAMAYRIGATISNMEFVQFHPSGLSGNGVLISEAARGEGGRLFNSEGERFMDKYAPNAMELASRDVVSRAILNEIREGRGVGPRKDAVFIDVTHLGKDLIMERLPELRDLAITFLGLDMIKEPILISATAHYSMGGIPVNIAGNVRKNNTEFVEGFYAAGECSCVSVHGANRLGANSVLEALLFGRYVGKTMVEEVDNIELREATQEDAQTALDEIDFILNNNGDETIPGLREELQQCMTANAGAFRTKETLEIAVAKVKALRSRFKNICIKDKSKVFNTELQEAIEFGHMLDYSLFIVESAVARNESRGAHYREDFETRNDEEFLKHTMAYMDEKGEISLDYMDVVLGKHELRARTY